MGRNAHIPAADTQKFIIEKTSVLFNKKGYTGTSLSDLEKVTGLTKGSIYANFKDKEDVSLKVFDYNFSQLCNAMSQRVNSETTAKGKLIASIDFYLDYYPSLATNGGCAVQNALIETDDANTLLFERAKDALISWKETTAAIIKEGILNNEFSKNEAPGDFAVYMIALIEGAILVSRSLSDYAAFKYILTKLKREIELL
ncbi:TetR/AcrR family transcriptional regulator [Mucilaginibacter sp. X4EP1]|uniref:TetR/AcrR family transcriptional regulator n=1 Tax=Mucilaginibacter sp. X4EP1 TaxID=2723092 RepID=UPI003B001109